jgi:adhesin/invasin
MKHHHHTIVHKANASWVRPLSYLQVAVQLAMAVTPFWVTTVHASKDGSGMDAPLHSTASHLSSLGQAAQSGNLKELPTQQASSFATQQVEQWLQNFGTARVELNTDRHFSTHTGAIDLLLPLYKSKEHLFFSQNGLRQRDDQITGNVGVGVRHFFEDWMLGYNGFYDQNISRGHKRLGTGVEAWRDFVKLSGNGYWRLSGWRDSGEIEDYNARPANGFDLRAEAWLPAYPALGGRLIYEKYYGDEVALFDKDKRQRNPNAVTAGLSWTPVPLLSFSTDHKKGASQSETTFGLQLSWQLGQSLASQLDSSNVGNKRTIAGSGMDLVERNNNIVLEYRKQQLIELSLPKEIAGESSATLPIAYKVQAKYGVAKIIWNKVALEAAGGKLVDTGNNNYQVVMPKYVVGAANRYTLSGVAYDARNNTSKIATTTVIVNAPAFNLEKSTLASSEQTILANGKATTNITLHLVNGNDQPITGLADVLKVSIKEKQDVALSSGLKTLSTPPPATPAKLSVITEQADGSYTMVLTAGTRPTEVQITARLDDVALPAISVQQISDAATAMLREDDINLLQDNAVANNLAENHIRVRITDVTGNAVAGIPVNYTLSGSARVSADNSLTAVSDKQGYSVLKFTNRIAETVHVGIKTANGSSVQIETHFKSDSENPDSGNSALLTTTDSLIADGQSTATLTLALKDSGGNAISGQTVVFTSNLSGSVVGAIIDNGDGSYFAPITSTKAGQAIISVKVNGRIFSVTPVTLTVAADSNNIDASQSVLETTTMTLVANGNTSSTLTLQLKDRNANPVSGQDVIFDSSLNGSNVSNVTDHGDGSYSALLTGIKSGIANITVKLGNVILPVNETSVTLTADSSTAIIGSNDLKVDKTTLVANNTDVAKYTVTVKDANSNILVNHPVNWSVNLGASTLSNATSFTNDAGLATVTLTGMREGSAVVQAKLANLSAVSARAVTFTVPVVDFINGPELTEAELGTILDNTEHAAINIYNGHWVGKITLPSATMYKNRKLTIEHSATIDTTLVVNGTNLVMSGESFIYTANGSSWVK